MDVYLDFTLCIEYGMSWLLNVVSEKKPKKKNPLYDNILNSFLGINCCK